jgi:diguanylate cyclase (GGDEF)-like protein
MRAPRKFRAFRGASGEAADRGFSLAPSTVPTTLTSPRSRPAPQTNSLPTPLAALEESRAGVAKAWLVRAIESTPLDQVDKLPVSRIAAELPVLVSELIRAAAGEGAAASERTTWLDRLAGMRGTDSPAPVARDLSALQQAMIESLERQADAFNAAELMGASARLAALFGDLHADAAERVGRAAGAGAAGSLDELLGGADRLTGLHGQGYMREHLRHLVAMQKRYDQPFAMVVVDVEGLKRINQAFGDRAGDETLVGVADAVGRTVRGVDTTVRMEEDEFCILLPNQTAGRAKIAAERLADAVEQVSDPAGGSLRVTIGIVACPQHAVSADELLELADSALYRAKAAGERMAVGGEDPPDLDEE